MKPDKPASLFDPATTVPKRCTTCKTTKKNLCRFDTDVHHGTVRASSRRYKGCLNAPDPATDPIPF